MIRDRLSSFTGDLRIEERRLPNGVTVAGFIRVLGKGGRERIIPFGSTLKNLLVDVEPGGRLKRQRRSLGAHVLAPERV